MTSPIDELAEGPIQQRAEAAVDLIRHAHRAMRRPRVLTAREALQVLSFESLVVMCAAAEARHGPLSDVDHARLVQACRRIEIVATEALS